MKKKNKNIYKDARHDPDGSYTGTRTPSNSDGNNEDYTPVQDADDL